MNRIFLFSVLKKLSNPQNWTKLINDRFKTNKIPHLPYYKNWTVDNILQNRAAIYKGVKTDVCLREILIQSEKHFPCYTSPICYEMMFDKSRVDSGYLLTHRFVTINWLSIKSKNNFFTAKTIVSIFKYKGYYNKQVTHKMQHLS